MYAGCLHATVETHVAYAKAHDYGYRWVIGNLSPTPQTANFNRYYLLRQAFIEDHYDWAMWIDADAIVIDATVTLESIIDRSPDQLLIACRGGNAGDFDINNGVFFLNLRHPHARELVEHCIEYCERLDRQSCGFRGDQKVMHDWLRLRQDIDGHLDLLRRYTDREYNLFNYDGQFVRHVLRTCGTLDQRIDELRRLATFLSSQPLAQRNCFHHGAFMSFQKQHGILVAAPAGYDPLPASASVLIESCHRFGIELTLLGQGQPFPNLRYKIDLVSEYLKNHPEYRYVLQLDVKDVLCCATLREMFAKYQSMGHAIVTSAERKCWPVDSHIELSPPTGTSCRYLNSGSIFATRDAWLDAWDVMQKKLVDWQGLPGQASREEMELLRRDDQAAWSDLYVHGEADIAIDARSDIFQVLHYTDWRIAAANPDYVFEGRRIKNRETGARPCLIHANANVPIMPWAKYVLNPPTVWIWPLINRLRTIPHRVLRDVSAVQDLLLELGLHQISGELPPGCMGDELLPYTGKGLGIWQRPDEFAEYLVWLSKRPPIRSYLEIGVESGGSFITTIEYLKRFHPLGLAIGVDPWYSPTVQEYVCRTGGVQFVRGTRYAPELGRLVDDIGLLDLVLIDGDHSAEGVRADWQFARSRSRYIAFHDIAANIPGIRSLWAEIRSTQTRTHEFLSRRSGASPWMGIGVVDMRG